jgi:hypothetical protein
MLVEVYTVFFLELIHVKFSFQIFYHVHIINGNVIFFFFSLNDYTFKKELKPKLLHSSLIKVLTIRTPNNVIGAPLFNSISSGIL